MNEKISKEEAEMTSIKDIKKPIKVEEF